MAYGCGLQLPFSPPLRSSHYRLASQLTAPSSALLTPYCFASCLMRIQSNSFYCGETIQKRSLPLVSCRYRSAISSPGANRARLFHSWQLSEHGPLSSPVGIIRSGSGGLVYPEIFFNYSVSSPFLAETFCRKKMLPAARPWL